MKLPLITPAVLGPVAVEVHVVSDSYLHHQYQETVWLDVVDGPSPPAVEEPESEDEDDTEADDSESSDHFDVDESDDDTSA